MGRSGPAHSKRAIVVDAACRFIIHTRRCFIYVISHLVSWLVLARSPAAFRRQQQLDLPESTRILVALQSHRTPALERLAAVYTALASQTFYTVAIPALFWVYDATFARHATFVVAFGVVAANILKDVFRLPRPPATPPLWTPAGGSGIHDFAFPSTHAINAVTTPVFLAMHLVSARVVTVWDPWFAVVVAAGAWHCAALCVARMFQGYVFLGDIKAGLVLGALVLCVAVSGLAKFDHWLMHDGEALPVYAMVVVAVLAVCPQPRPVTPSFLQSAQLMGLTFGVALGSVLTAASPHGWSQPGSVAAAASRLAVGGCVVAAVLCCRSLLRTQLHALVEAQPASVRAAVGPAVDANKAKPTVPPVAGEEPHEGADPDDSPLITRAVLIDACTTVVHASLTGVTVTWAAPALFAALGV